MFGRSRAAEPRQAHVETEICPAQTRAPVGQTQQQRQHSYLSKDARFMGDLVSAGDVTIEGILDGRIQCRSLTLSGTPQISGSIEADTVHVCGSFEGELHAKKVILSKAARLIGDIFQESLEIHPGAVFEGLVTRLDIRPSGHMQGAKAKVADAEPQGQSQSEPPSAA